MKKLALFDFCETLVGFQTAGPYVDFVREQEQSKKMFRVEKIRVLLKKIRVTAVVNKLFPYLSFDKRIKLFQLRGLNRSALEKYAEIYYQHFIVPDTIPELIEEIKKMEALGYTISIISGGYSIYLQYFAKDHHIDHVIANEIAFDKNDTCTGKMKGKDCMYHYKIDKIKSYFPEEKIIQQESVVYSDSITDLPLLLWAGKGVVISKERTQSWAASNGLHEIIWNREMPLMQQAK